MPRPRWDRLAPDVRQAILDTASEEFAEKGFDSASFNRIIDRAGLSKGAVYYYFDDKEDLFSTVMGRAVKVFHKSIGGFGPVSTPEEFWTEFESFLNRGAAFKLGNPVFVRLGIAMLRAIHSRRTSLPVRLVYREFMSLLEDILRKGQAVGAVRNDMPPELLVSIVFAASQPIQEWYTQLVSDQAFDLSRVNLPESIRYVLALYRRILLPGDEQPLEVLLGVPTQPAPLQEDKNERH